MKLRDLAIALCDLYDLPRDIEVESFLIQIEPHTKEDIIGNRLPDREALFIRESQEYLDLGLFLAPQILQNLEANDPLLHLDAFAAAIEGISHLLYVIDRASRELKVSQLELELQAEVDKYLLISMAAYERFEHVPLELFHRQFQHCTFDPRLSAEERERYETASFFAAKYCAWLRERCFHPMRRSELTTHAREFFRKDLFQKVTWLIS